MKPHEIGGHLVETGAADGDGRAGDGNSCYSSLSGNPRTKRIGQAVNSPFLTTMSHLMLPSSQQTDHGSGRSKSHATFNILKNLITCSAVKINDSVIVLRHSCIKKTTLSSAGLEICKEGNLGSSARLLGDPWDKHQHHTARYHPSPCWYWSD